MRRVGSRVGLRVAARGGQREVPYVGCGGGL